MRPAGWHGRAATLVCVAAVAAQVLVGCGLPDERRTQVVEDSSVPYDLLGPAEAANGDQTEESPAPRGAPVVFWVGPDELLVPAAVDVSCEVAPADVVRQVLGALTASPSAAERDAGLASALPPTTRLDLVQVEDGVAEIDLDVAIGDAERLPLAVGQVVLSVTSAPGVDAVRLVAAGRPVDLPLPGGALATGAATADDYATLLPARLAPSVADSGGIGCPPPST